MKANGDEKLDKSTWKVVHTTITHKFGTNWGWAQHFWLN